VSNPSHLSPITGPNLVLRLIEPSDAAYVHGLRTDPALSRYLSPVQGGVEDQRNWIVAYQQREAAGEEFYYIIARPDGQRCGTVRIYGLEDDSFIWGSWILDSNKPRKAALESAVLSFGVGFDQLARTTAKVDVRVANTHATAFYRRLGMTEVHRTDQDIFFTYARARFEADRVELKSILQSEDEN
jgi:RimJ/RimL family protein N-acetyltransferase